MTGEFNEESFQITIKSEYWATYQLILKPLTFYDLQTMGYIF